MLAISSKYEGGAKPFSVDGFPFLDTEPEQTAEALISILEPLLIVILGIIIGLVLIAIYLPLFD